MALIPLLGIAAENNNFSTTTLPRSIYVDVSNRERTEILPLKTENGFTFRTNVGDEDAATSTSRSSRRTARR